MSSAKETLGSEIRRLRTVADVTLRQFAREVGVTAAFMSDVEHDRRRPSKKHLETIAKLLAHVGATLEKLASLDTRIDSDTKKWVDDTPGANVLLRRLRDSKVPIDQLNNALEQLLSQSRKKKPK